MKKIKFNIRGFIYILLAVATTVLIPILVKDTIDGNRGLISFIDNKIFLPIIFILNVILSSLARFEFINQAEREVYNLRKKMLSNLFKTQYKFYDENDTGKIISHLTTNINIHREYISKSVPNFISGIFVIIASLISLFILDWKLSLVLIISLPVLAVVIMPLSALVAKYSDRLQNHTANFVDKSINFLDNVMYIKSINAEDETCNILNKDNLDMKKYSVSAGKMDAIMSPFLMMVLLVILSIVFIYGGIRVKSGEITIGILISFLLYVFQLLTPVSSFGSFFTDKAKNKANADVLLKYLEVDREDINENIIGLKEIKDVNFKDVSFKYKEHGVFEKFNFSFKKGEKVAIVGPSGAGDNAIMMTVQ